MIVDCHTHIWESPEQLGQALAAVESRSYRTNPSGNGLTTLPDASAPKTDQALVRWIDEIQRRQTFDLRPWHDAGEQALQQAHVRQTLEQLHAPSASNWTVPTCLDSAVPRTTSSNTIRRSSVTCAN